MTKKIFRGDIWLINLDPTMGFEMNKTRPCLIISHDRRNKFARIVTVIPITSRKVEFDSWQIELDHLQCGLDMPSYLDIPQIRVADKTCLLKRIGIVPVCLYKSLFMRVNMVLGFEDFLLG